MTSPVFTDDVADALVISIVPMSLRRDGRVWLGSWMLPRLPQVLRKVPATLHQHRPTVIDVDAYEALLADDAAAE